NSPPARGVADRRVRLWVDPGGDEAFQPRAARGDHPKRSVAGARQLRGFLDEALQQRVERELGADRDACLDERAQPVLVLTDPLHFEVSLTLRETHTLAPVRLRCRLCAAARKWAPSERRIR